MAVLFIRSIHRGYLRIFLCFLDLQWSRVCRSVHGESTSIHWWLRHCHQTSSTRFDQQMRTVDTIDWHRHSSVHTRYSSSWIEFISIVVFDIDPLFTAENLRSHFGTYGTVVDLKMLEEESCAGLCLLSFADTDSSDRVLLDLPHHLNGQLLSIYKYASPEYICTLSQFRFIKPNEVERIQRWHSIYRNFTGLIRPLRVLHKTQLALLRDDLKQEINVKEKSLYQAQTDLEESDEKYQRLKEDVAALRHAGDQLRSQIDQATQQTDDTKRNYEAQIEEYQRSRCAKAWLSCFPFLQINQSIKLDRFVACLSEWIYFLRLPRLMSS